MICPFCHMGEGFFHDPYCRESTPFNNPRCVVVAQENANRSASESKNDAPREMTAEDLGLPLRQWSDEWLMSMYGHPQGKPDCYAFWLGAEAA